MFIRIYYALGFYNGYSVRRLHQIHLSLAVEDFENMT